MKMTYGSLFSGIGGMDLGLDRAGMQCKWQVEIDPFCRQVLRKHWPDVPKHNDVTEFARDGTGNLEVDCIAGGFPCQDISELNARGTGVKGKRSGLWHEYARIIRILQPKYVLIENVHAITFRGLGTVLGSLAKFGYDAEWQTLSAEMLGAPHRRKRVFIVAYSQGKRCNENAVFSSTASQGAREEQEKRRRRWPGEARSSGTCPDRVRWVPDSGVCRVVDGVPGRLDRYRGIGNAVVPECAEFIGRMILNHHEQQGKPCSTTPNAVHAPNASG